MVLGSIARLNHLPGKFPVTLQASGIQVYLSAARTNSLV